MKTRLFCALAATLLWSACFAHPVEVAPAAYDAGFWDGYWHGLILPIMGIKRLLGHEVALYEVAAASRVYDLGYIAGSGTLLQVLVNLVSLLSPFYKDKSDQKTKDTIKENQSKLVSRTALIILAALFTDAWSATLTASAAVPPQGAEICGFWSGVGHRFVSSIAWAFSLFRDDVAIFQAGCHQTPYETGFYATELVTAVAFVAFMAILGIVFSALMSKLKR
jgi:hypothetical protein